MFRQLSKSWFLAPKIILYGQPQMHGRIRYDSYLSVIFLPPKLSTRMATIHQGQPPMCGPSCRGSALPIFFAPKSPTLAVSWSSKLSTSPATNNRSCIVYPKILIIKIRTLSLKRSSKIFTYLLAKIPSFGLFINRFLPT